MVEAVFQGYSGGALDVDGVCLVPFPVFRGYGIFHRLGEVMACAALRRDGGPGCEGEGRGEIGDVHSLVDHDCYFMVAYHGLPAEDISGKGYR